MTELTRFVVLAAPRTGSNWLCTMLDSPPEILCHHEIFNPDFILMAQSCRDGGLDAVLGDRAIRKIVLGRRNRVKSYVSEALAQATGEWESYPHSPASAEERRIDASAGALRAHIAANQAYYNDLYARMRERGDTPLELSYERLHDAGEQRRALEFLGVSPVAGGLRALTRKQSSRDLRHIIRNFDQFAEELAGTELASELWSVDD